ncbi:MAG: hypothetical protein LWX11_11480, partial [Firmicutes bacterium]|nr:hypothetical protein [Bacillota bacterium]
MRLFPCGSRFTLAFCAGVVAVAQEPGTMKLDPSEMILLQPYLGKTPLADPLSAFPIPGGTLVPLGELCNHLGFGIRVEGDKGLAEGFFIAPHRKFRLDLTTRVAEVEGRRLPLGVYQAVGEGREIFVDARLLALWFPLDVVVNQKASSLRITPRERLPLEEEWEREGKATSLTQGSQDERPVGIFLPTPYSALSMPFVDFSTYWGRNQGGSSSSPSVSVQMAGDLAWMSALFFATRDTNGQIKNSMFSLFREDPHAELLGPLHATRVELGSLQAVPSLDLVGGLPRGRGILVDNYPMSYRSKFATRTFQGLLEEGWSVELYQNTALLGYQRARPDRRYEFRDIPLRFGLNQFKLIFHGPFGERREETYRVDIASDLPPPGTFYYRVASTKPTSEDQSQSMGWQPGQPLPERRVSSLLEMEYGFTPYLAGSTQFARVPAPNGDVHSYTGVGLRTLFSHLSLQGNVAQDSVPGQRAGLAAQGILRTGVDYSSLSLERSEYRRGFERTDFQGYGLQPQHLRSETRVQWTGNWIFRNRPVGLSLSRSDQRFVEGSGTLVDSLRATITYPTFVVSPALSLTKNYLRPDLKSLDGEVYVTFRRGDYDFQGQVSATRMAGHTQLTEWSFLTNRTLPSGLLVRLGLRGRDTDLKHSVLQASLSKLTGGVGYGLDFHYSKDGGYSLNLRFQASFGREPRTGKWVHNARAMSSQGAVSLLAFRDDNGNQKRDPGEVVIDETRFRLGNAPIENTIKDSKVVFRTLIPRGQEVSLRLNEASLDDPSLHPTVRVYRIVPRPGKVTQVDFA